MGGLRVDWSEILKAVTKVAAKAIQMVVLLALVMVVKRAVYSADEMVVKMDDILVA